MKLADLLHPCVIRDQREGTCLGNNFLGISIA